MNGAGNALCAGTCGVHSGLSFYISPHDLGRGVAEIKAFTADTAPLTDEDIIGMKHFQLSCPVQFSDGNDFVESPAEEVILDGDRSENIDDNSETAGLFCTFNQTQLADDHKKPSRDDIFSIIAHREGFVKFSPPAAGYLRRDLPQKCPLPADRSTCRDTAHRRCGPHGSCCNHR